MPRIKRSCSDQVLPKQSKKKKLVSTRVAKEKHDYLTVENYPEILINEGIPLISMIDAASWQEMVNYLTYIYTSQEKGSNKENG